MQCLNYLVAYFQLTISLIERNREVHLHEILLNSELFGAISNQDTQVWTTCGKTPSKNIVEGNPTFLVQCRFSQCEESTNPEVPSKHQDHQRAWNGWCHRCSIQSSPCSSSGCWLWSSSLSGQLISFVVAQICFEITSVAHKGMKWQTSLTSQELKSCCHPPLCKIKKEFRQTQSKIYSFNILCMQDIFINQSGTRYC